MPIRPLPVKKLYRRCDAKQLDFADTTDLRPLTQPLGQQRALEALEVGVGLARHGYNIYALGPAGLGKHGLVQRFIERARRNREVPQEWCYVHNFADPKRPKALDLPAGTSKRFVSEMEQLVEDLRTAIMASLDSDEFRARRDAVEAELKEYQEKGLKEIQEHAQQSGIAMLHTPAGIGFAPAKDGEVIRPEVFEKLSEKKKKELAKAIGTLQSRLQDLLQQVPRKVRETRKRVEQLIREAITFAVREPIDELRKRYRELPKVLDHLEALRGDVIDHAGDFLRPDHSPQGKQPPAGGEAPTGSPFDRYKVNLLIERAVRDKTPVVYEVNPTYQNLVGQIEHLSHMGALVTDFTLIKPGALHRANGGYLIIDARKLLQQPYAYEALKQALRIQQIRIESLGQMLSLVSTVSLEPEPIPLNVKVVLIGERLLYYLLSHHDPEFRDLFKIAADFEEELDWSDRNVPLYARLVATLVQRNELKPLNRRAVARVIERSARLCGDAEKLSIRVESIADLVREADYWCGRENRRVIDARHIQQAIDAEQRRNGRVREHLHQQTLRETVLIDTAGERLGQVNGLSVLQLGGYAFGRPSRITATVRLGKGELVDIEREVQLGGPLHSKGVMILAGFLGARFGQQRPLALSARLVFEQSYGGVDGDSASSAELYALLSALAQAPIGQHFAVTGSVNQHGEIQAIGGVNEKIEGFFDLCAARGLNGRQGVLIPRANVKHLMLATRVVEAVKQRLFNVYAVSTADEGIEILTGIPAGKPRAAGHYPDGTINARVERRLDEMAEQARGYAGAPAKPEPKEDAV